MGGLQIMKHKTKPIVIIILTAITALLITFRIIYVNNTLYSIPERYIYAVNEEFECYGMSMSLSDYKIYSGEKLNNIYNNELEGMTDDNDIMFNLTIKLKAITQLHPGLCMDTKVAEVQILIYINISILKFRE